jgi:hypothetical protein
MPERVKPTTSWKTAIGLPSMRGPEGRHRVGHRHRLSNRIGVDCMQLRLQRLELTVCCGCRYTLCASICIVVVADTWTTKPGWPHEGHCDPRKRLGKKPPAGPR